MKVAIVANFRAIRASVFIMDQIISFGRTRSQASVKTKARRASRPSPAHVTHVRSRRIRNSLSKKIVEHDRNMHRRTCRSSDAAGWVGMGSTCVAPRRLIEDAKVHGENLAQVKSMAYAANESSHHSSGVKIDAHVSRYA